jgi:hypothetical protein
MGNSCGGKGDTQTARILLLNLLDCFILLFILSFHFFSSFYNYFIIAFIFVFSRHFNSFNENYIFTFFILVYINFVVFH